MRKKYKKAEIEAIELRANRKVSSPKKDYKIEINNGTQHLIKAHDCHWGDNTVSFYNYRLTKPKPCFSSCGRHILQAVRCEREVVACFHVGVVVFVRIHE